MAKIGRLRKNEFRFDVSESIKSNRQRFPIELNTHDTFYISRGYNIVCPCRVLSEHKDWKGRPMNGLGFDLRFKRWKKSEYLFR